MEEPKTEIYNLLEVLDQENIMNLLGIKRTTLFKLLKANVLPVVKMGKKYYTTAKLMEEWFSQMQGHEIFL